MNRTDKSAVVDRLREALETVPAIVVADFKGMSVEETDLLRSEVRKAGVTYEVVKNTLARRAVAGTDKEGLNTFLKGNTAIAFHPEDPAAPAKVLRDFAKNHDALKLKGAWLSGNILDADGVKQLADMPGKDELRGKLLSVLIGVPTKFVRTLAAGPQTFVQLLAARAQSLSE